MSQIPVATYANPANFGECTTDTNPTVLFNDCAEEVVQNKSEIAGVLISMPSSADPNVPEYVPADPSDLAAWEAAITAGTVSHEYVVGNKDAPESNPRDISRGRVLRGNKTHTVVLDVDENTDENYEAMRAREDAPIIFFWYYTLGNKIYGGTTGIKCKITDANQILARGKENYENIQYTLTWEAKTHPPRNDSPFTL